MGQAVNHQLCIANRKNSTDQSTHHGSRKPFGQHLSAHLVRREADCTEQPKITHSLLDPQPEQQPDQDHRCDDQEHAESKEQTRKRRHVPFQQIEPGDR